MCSCADGFQADAKCDECNLVLAGDTVHAAHRAAENAANILGINNKFHAAATSAYATVAGGVLPPAMAQAGLDLLAQILEEQRNSTATMGQLVVRIEQLNTTLVASQVRHTSATRAACTGCLHLILVAYASPHSSAMCLLTEMRE